ncbi:MAG: hypothetical protein HY282_14665 [Nitrospirae bacterium]|nr:hypothetical protein [Candidatus Manganitrophaceae bacterium]
MATELEVNLDPAKTPDTVRQSTIEKLVYNSAVPDPKIVTILIPIVQKEPVEWIQKLEMRLLKRLPFNPETIGSIASLLSVPKKEIRLETAILLRNLLVQLVTEKRKDDRPLFEAKLRETLIARLRAEGDGHNPVWMELYKTLSYFSATEEITSLLIEMLPKGGEEALLHFAQYTQGKYPPAGLETLLTNAETVKEDDTAIHIMRAFIQTLPKEGPSIGYPSTEPMIRVLINALTNRSENIRKEAAIALASRAKVARKEKKTIPLESEVWEALFNLYQLRLPSTTALDKDHAREGLRNLPADAARLAKLFELMHRVQDELQKQNVVGLIGTFKTPETRAELIRMVKVNFTGLRLEAQKTTIDAISGFVPDQEVEAEMEKLLEGKGLHADVQAKLADKLFSEIPSLKARLLRWLRVDEKSKRPVLERFDLPMMHIKVIESAKKLPGDGDICKKLLEIEPMLMMNDAKVKLHETLREFPQAANIKPAQILPMDQVAKTLIGMIEPLNSARIVFDGFTLPAEFGGSKELEFGNVQQAKAQGLGMGAAQMGKDFVKKMIEDLFAGDLGEFAPAGTKFKLSQEDEGLFTVAVAAAVAAAKH